MSRLEVTIDDRTYEVDLDLFPQNGSEIQARIDGQSVRVFLSNLERSLDEIEWAVVDDRPYEVVFDLDLHWIMDFRGTHSVKIRDLEALVPHPVGGDGRIKAPIPGQIARVFVAIGDRVEAGQPLLILEAMKMQNEIRAQRPGVVSAVHVAAGENVSRGEVLAEVE
jgi:acetyl/propionyl-CoA carboxylase alpha subunit